MKVFKSSQNYLIVILILSAFLFTGCLSEDTSNATVNAVTVTSTSFSNGETGVAVNKMIAATFSESMAPATINNETFLLKTADGNPVTGLVNYDGGLIGYFMPSSNLLTNTVYYATITTGARTLSSKTLASNFSWGFTTGASADISTPGVTSTDPSNGDTSVAVNKKIVVIFNESMNSLTITPVTFTVAETGGSSVPGSVINFGLSASFTPTESLKANTMYTAAVNKALTDLAGNSLTTTYTWTFTTGSAGDAIAPTVINTDPAGAATLVALNKKIVATFSEGMNPITLNNITFKVTASGQIQIPGTVTNAGSVSYFTPLNNLSANTIYTATIMSGVQDLSGNMMSSNYSWTFTTVNSSF